MAPLFLFRITGVNIDLTIKNIQYEKLSSYE